MENDDVVELEVTSGVPFTVKSGVHYQLTVRLPDPPYPDIDYVISGIERPDQGFSTR